ncbi:MAG: hypothetical protein ABI891_01385 [Acidobacteriota bacterium]
MFYSSFSHNRLRSSAPRIRFCEGEGGNRFSPSFCSDGSTFDLIHEPTSPAIKPATAPFQTDES